MRKALSVGLSMGFLMGFLLFGCTRGEEKPGAGGEATPQPTASQPSATGSPESETEADFLMVFADAEPEEGAPPLQVKFTAEISGGSGQKKVVWDFGDGTSSSEVNPVHVYEKPGTYLATVQVSDSTGDEDDDDVEVIVEEPEEEGQGAE